MNAGNFSLSFERILFEIVKTCLECWLCHNRYGPDLIASLPDECFGNYKFVPRPFCIVQESIEGKALYSCTKNLLVGDIEKYTFEYVSDTIVAQTFFTDIRDAVLFDKERWDAVTSKVARQQRIMRFYLQGQKRLAGGCYICDDRFDNIPLKGMAGQDCHHVEESEKMFNPSDGASRSIVAKALGVAPADLGVVAWLRRRGL